MRVRVELKTCEGVQKLIFEIDIYVEDDLTALFDVLDKALELDHEIAKFMAGRAKEAPQP